MLSLVSVLKLSRYFVQFLWSELVGKCPCLTATRRHIVTRCCCATQKIRFHIENVVNAPHNSEPICSIASGGLYTCGSWLFVLDHGDSRGTKLCLGTYLNSTLHGSVNNIKKSYPPRGLETFTNHNAVEDSLDACAQPSNHPTLPIYIQNSRLW